MARIEVTRLVHEAVRDSSSKKAKSISSDERVRDLFSSNDEFETFCDNVVQKAKTKGFEVRRSKIPSHAKVTIGDVVEAVEGELAGDSGKRPPI